MGSNHSIVKLIAIGIIIIYIGTGIVTSVENSEDESKSVKEKFLSLISKIKDLIHDRNFEGTKVLDGWDVDGDGEWDYIFNPITGRLTVYEKGETAKGSPVMLLLMIGIALALIAVIVYLYKKDYF